MKCFTSEDIKDEDWAEIQKAVNIPDLDRSDIRMSDFTELYLFRFEEVIQEIVVKASYKQKLAEKLELMQNDMDALQLQQYVYKSNIYLIKGYD